MDISKATKRNWEKLGSDITNKLKKRANKRNSSSYIIDDDYLNIITYIQSSNYNTSDIIYTLCLKLLSNHPLYNEFKDKFDFNYLDIDINLNELKGYDPLGRIYQSLTQEGQRNKNGIYYTDEKIIDELFEDIIFKKDDKILDICCGSGRFLLNCDVDMSQLYGCDNDINAVMICVANLLLKYHNCNELPNIICCDSLQYKFDTEFDYIFTNPPWVSKYDYKTENIKSKELSSLFIEKCTNIIKDNGILGFVLPKSLLSVKTHKDIRKFIIDNLEIEFIKMHNEKFNGVYTDYFNIRLKKNKVYKQKYKLNSDDIEFDNLIEPYFYPKYDIKIKEVLDYIYSQSKYSLKDSIFFMGIVTGDNEKKILKSHINNSVKIYSGKEVFPYEIKDTNKYIIYDRDNLQQVAKDDYYNADEKLVYRFISKDLIFSYDDKQRLFLNSANMIITKNIPILMKCLMCLFNSKLYKFIYSCISYDVKVLKDILLQLPIPYIPRETEEKILKMLVNKQYNDIDDIIYKIYNLDDKKINLIYEFINK